MLNRVMASVTAVLVLAAVAACGSAPAPAPASAGAAFPVTVTHKLGSTTIPALPQRVVAVGLRDQDFALALGVVPLGVADWFAGLPGGLGPWAKAAAGGAEPSIVATADTVNFEAVAALRPDLILAIYSTSDAGVYAKLSAIAPTVAAPVGTEDYALSWQDQLAQTGAALGRSDHAQQLTADLETRLAAVRTEHPEFAGRTAAYGGLGQFPGAFTAKDQRGRFLESIGFTVPAAVNALATQESAYFGAFSRENYHVLDADVSVLTGTSADPAAAIAAEPLLGGLGSVKEGRAVFLDELQGAWSGALSFDSPLSLPYALDTFVPALAAAVDGNPATPVPAEPPMRAAG